MNRFTNAFGVQRSVRRPWRRYIDRLAEHRPALHAYCRRLTGNVWDGEDLVQDTLVRVFSLLGKTDARLENPKAYLIRTATNLWIDRVRRRAREQAAIALEQGEAASTPFQEAADGRPAAKALFQMLHPQERAAVLMKDVFELSLEETAALLCTTVGAVKSALSRARGRLEGERPAAGFDAPPKELVERFMRALAATDMEAMKTLCAAHVSVELVGGVELDSFEKARTFFTHAHMVMPRLGFGERPWWKLAEYEGEPIVLGFRTLDRVEGINEIHRIDALDDRIVRVRTYCFCPETLSVVAEVLGCTALPRPHRSPSLGDLCRALLGLTPPWRRDHGSRE
jgi:RNA polymerase sigma-70 factor (ECF subfamily)